MLHIVRLYSWLASRTRADVGEVSSIAILGWCLVAAAVVFAAYVFFVGVGGVGGNFQTWLSRVGDSITDMIP